MSASNIVSVAIHPSIGISRIGNAPNDWFLAPDVRGATPVDADGFRDAKGRIKRQVARFRIYATLDTGEVRELTADEADIEWRVEVGNVKAGWYDYHYPMDLPVKDILTPAFRNAKITGDQRDALCIRPKGRAISGRDQSGAAYHFDDGTFYDKPVKLGELRTDSAGRLLFFGGTGDSAPKVAGTPPTTFANNKDWHDDTCDGPVRAHVRVGGQEFDPAPAHVIVAPPNFGPGLFGIVTMDDVVRDLFAQKGWLPAPTGTSFTQDVWPIFDRMTANQWVNDGIFLVAGQGTPLDARNQVFALFRKPGEDRPEALPPFYGDAFGDKRANGDFVDPTRQELQLTNLQYWHLDNWTRGRFDADWQGVPSLPDFDALTGAEQVEQLDRAGLYECLGGPFHPGIEITWPMRLETMWDGPYRLRSLEEGEPVPLDYGETLSVETALAPDGPNGASGAGSLTRWMGVPWQTDEASCNSGMIYSPELYLSSPSFWGARVPNQVLSQDAFHLATAADLTDQQRDRHFSNRHLWLRDINGSGYLPRIDSMVSRWWRLGLVEAKTPPGGLGLPDPMFVESGRISGATSDPTMEMVESVLALDKYDPSSAKLAVTVSSDADVEADDAPQGKRGYKTFHRGEI